MLDTTEIWKFFAGIGFFLLGLQQMDSALTKLAGRRFKTFLRNSTSGFLKSVAGGAIITALLQTSSVVALITLGFVEAGMIPFKNALGVIMGSNLGSTVVGWIIATIGFRINIESLAMPGLAISTIGMFFSRSRKNIYNSFRLLFALSLLFFGLAFMKETAEQLFKGFDITVYQHYPLVIFVVIGLLITAIIQTSAAAMAIAMTALYMQSITLEAAAALVIGSEVGTSLKTWASGISGGPEKRKAGYGNLYFNVVTTVFAFACLHPILRFIREGLKITDPLISLVMFQTLINLATILIFLPFINRFVRWLDQQYNQQPADASFVRPDILQAKEITAAMLKNEAVHLLHKTIAFHDLALDIQADEEEGLAQQFRRFTRLSGQTQGMYERLKTSEGQLLEMSLQENGGNDEATTKIMTALRQCIHAAKSVKDIHHNMDELEQSASDTLHTHYHRIGENWEAFKNSLLAAQDKAALDILIRHIHTHYQQQSDLIRADIIENKVSELEASTLLNIEREILSSGKSLVGAWELLMLE